MSTLVIKQTKKKSTKKMSKTSDEGQNTNSAESRVVDKKEPEVKVNVEVKPSEKKKRRSPSEFVVPLATAARMSSHFGNKRARHGSIKSLDSHLKTRMNELARAIYEKHPDLCGHNITSSMIRDAIGDQSGVTNSLRIPRANVKRAFRQSLNNMTDAGSLKFRIGKDGVNYLASEVVPGWVKSHCSPAVVKPVDIEPMQVEDDATRDTV